MYKDTLTALAIAALATYRIAQLVAVDDGPFFVFAKLRGFFGVRASGGGAIWTTLAGLVHCPRCVGVWVALAMIAALGLQIAALDFALLVFAAAGGQLFLTEVGYGSDMAD